MSEGNKVLENNTNILHKISKEEYKDEWFIDNAILCYKAQNERVFTFFRNNSQKDWLKKYNWCQRPDNTTMSLKRFDHIGNVHGHMSESLAEHYGLEQIDLNTFMHEFVAKLVEELNNLKEIEKSHKEENGKLRVELEQEKEKNKLSDNEKEIINSYRMLVEETGREDWIICNPKTMWCNYFVSKETIMQEIKNIEKRMETATNSTEYQKLHCAQEYLRGLLWEV